MVAMPVLKPLHDAAGLTEVVVATYQAVSGSGLAGVAELAEQLAKTVDRAAELTFDGSAVDFPAPVKFPAPIAHNVVPMAGSLVDDGSRRDRRGAEVPRREPQDPRPARACSLTCTCVRVPVFTGHSAAIVGRVRLRARPGRGRPRCSAGPRASPWPTSRPRCGRRAATSRCVGRIRRAEGARQALALFVVGDNLRKGAALNAVQIAEALLALALLEPRRPLSRRPTSPGSGPPVTRAAMRRARFTAWSPKRS